MDDEDFDKPFKRPLPPLTEEDQLSPSRGLFWSGLAMFGLLLLLIVCALWWLS